MDVAVKKEFRLKLYDQELIRFDAWEDDFFSDLKIEIHAVQKDFAHLFPVEMLKGVTEDSLKEWLTGRTIPKNRRFVHNLLAVAGLTYDDTLGILSLCKGLSINDSFWLEEVGQEKRFEEVNLFENPLDEMLSLVAYTGVGSKQKHRLGLSTEWTTSGQFAKAWRRIDGELFLYKAGSDGFANAGMEPYSEFFASQLAATLGLDAVCYDLRQWKGKLASVCPLFNTKDISFVPFWKVTNITEFPQNLAAGLALGEDIFSKIRTQVVFDSLICNVDRHGGNYGFLRDNKTGEILGLAPLFDHNLSLFARDMDSDFAYWGQRANEVMFPCSSRFTFVRECENIMGESQHAMLRKAIGFSFENHPNYPVSQKRLDALNYFLAGRIQELLRIPVVEEDVLRKRLSETLEEKDMEHLSGIKLAGERKVETKAKKKSIKGMVL